MLLLDKLITNGETLESSKFRVSIGEVHATQRQPRHSRFIAAGSIESRLPINHIFLRATPEG